MFYQNNNEIGENIDAVVHRIMVSAGTNNTNTTAYKRHQIDIHLYLFDDNTISFMRCFVDAHGLIMEGDFGHSGCTDNVLSLLIQIIVS